MVKGGVVYLFFFRDGMLRRKNIQASKRAKMSASTLFKRKQYPYTVTLFPSMFLVPSIRSSFGDVKTG
jgi:hypothetical protein